MDRYAPDGQVTLVGQSWGGMYGTSFINRHPTRVREAVFIETGPLEGSTFERIKGELFDLHLLREWLNDLAWTSQFFSADDHIRKDYQMAIGSDGSQPRNNTRKGPGAEPFWRLGAMANRYVQEDGQDAKGRFTYDFTTNLQQFTGRVLLIAGSRSEVLGPSLQLDQQALYRHASVQVVQGGGHDVHWTHTPAVLELMRTFFSASGADGAQ